MKRARSRFIAVCLGIFMLPLSIAALEGACYLLVRAGFRMPEPSRHPERLPREKNNSLPTTYKSLPILNPKPMRYESGEFLTDQHFDHQFYDMQRGLIVPRQGRVRAEGYSSRKELLFSATYTVDKLGYREIPINKGAKEFAAFFGDSFTFGIGTSDHETMPYAFSSRSPKYHVYNFAVPSYGLNDLLVRAEWQEAQGYVKENKGLVLYVYNSDHVFRLLGGISYVGLWGDGHPYFRPGPGNFPEHEGSFNEAAPLWTLFSKLLARSYTMKFCRFDWPTWISDTQALFFGNAVAKFRDVVKRELPGGRFIVVISPGENTYSRQVREVLEKLGIEYLDYSDFHLGFYIKGPRYIAGDGHHTAEANRLFGEQLAKDLGNL